MLPERDLPLRVFGTRAFIDFLGPQDEPWLRVLVGEMARFEGRRWRELAERLAEPLPCQAPHLKRRAATRVLARLWRRERTAAVPPVEARARVFGAAAEKEGPARDEILAETAAALGIDAGALAEALFGDLPGERRVRAPAPLPSPTEAALRVNLAVAQAVLMRADRVDVRVVGAVRPIVRLAKLQGLLCLVRTAQTDAVLEISGPFSLFRHTLLYGRAVASLLPQLAWCARFELRASAALRGRLAEITLESGAPIFPGAPPRQYDSRLEERFARDFARLAPDWDLLREPEPLPAGDTLLFPDFLLQHRLCPQRRAYLEIIGFWTPDYVAAKLAKLQDTAVPRMIVCIDDERACGTDVLPGAWPVLRFRRRIDAAAVLRAAERLA